MHELTLHSTDLPRRKLILSLRYIVYFCVWLCMWQGASFSGSIFQLEIIALYPGMPLCEAALLIAGIALMLERWMTKDYSLKRSYFGAPMSALFVLLVFSWMRGQYMLQAFRPVYEVHEAILIPIGFLIYINAFRDVRERKILAWIFITAAIMKAADAAWIRFFADATEARWGALLMWRDGYILALGMAGALILAHYHGNTLKRLRTVALVSVPFLAYGLLVSYRRTFIIAIILACVAMIVSLGRGRRLKHLRNFFFILLIISISVLFTDPLGMIARMAGTFMPTEEGSSYIRLLEYPNIIRNISDYPIFGLPVGVKWHMYYHIPLFANSTALGAHNTYLYWALRTGIIGFAAFMWLLARVWKVVLINWRLQRTEEDFFYNHFLLYAFGLYNFGCFFGLMYSDAMGIMTGLLLVFLQLQMVKITGLESLKNVDFLKTMRRKQIVMRPKIGFTPEAAKLADELRMASQTKS
jgi:O-antigen ligase